MLLLVSEHRVYAVPYSHPWVIDFQPGDVLIDPEKELYSPDGENWYNYIYHEPPTSVEEAVVRKTIDGHLAPTTYLIDGKEVTL